MAALAPAPARAQPSELPLHGTVLGWSDRTWNYLLDPGAVEGGRLTSLGWLQRFNAEADNEQLLDLVSIHAGPVDEYQWQSLRHGVRTAGGSINKRDMLLHLSMKTSVPLARGWSLWFRFDKEDEPNLARDLPRFGVERQWEGGAFAFGEATLFADKTQIDLGCGGGWRHDRGELRAAITLLDLATNVIYQSIGVIPEVAPIALDHERRPLALRATGRWRFNQHVRVEADVGAALASRFRAYDQVRPDDGFRQAERFAMATGLVEWTTLPWLRAGASGAWVRAIRDRTPLALGGAQDDFRLEEETTNLSGYVLVHPWRRWRFESWLTRVHRPETRDHRQDAAPDVDYEDRGWQGQLLVRYTSPIGFTANTAWELDLRDVIRGAGQVPSLDDQPGDHTRLHVELGWRFDDHFRFEAGLRIDTDPAQDTWFDGLNARGLMIW